MKITRIETIVLNLPILIDGATPMLGGRARTSIDMLLVRIDTDAGITGEARLRPASAGDTSASGSGGVTSAPGSSPRRASRRRIRMRIFRRSAVIRVDEASDAADIERGANVLLHTLVALAG